MAINNPLHGNIEPLGWESHFFQLNSARLTPDASAGEITPQKLEQYALVQAKVEADQTHTLDALSALGFRLAEGETDFCVTVTPQDMALPAGRLALPQDIADVAIIASQTFRFSRFRAPWYQPDDSARFYAMWAEKAILGTFDHLCLWADDAQGNGLGFVTLRRLSEDEVRIGLLAVRPEFQGQGAGKKLMAAAKNWCAGQGVSRLYVATQTGNIAALNLYLASGGKVMRSAYWLYR
ncbi:dTDP-4-amino-4,6-dideoxy-D-galactose acyltransferase [Rahnella sp. C60]|uniref:dTDP-4-amino-4,6-dideoxy-D-galactose acyltransferase n=1 Tax=Rahnella TaxID=34037 RepID=UPI00101EB786|nr:MULTISPECIES: dTDP-4-amino-4,6-dideoxy-D-galactose acyltransferase [Rahnella]MBU9812561.1 dTDP-4-amino-4,6-dideoxy-D-galactose acyltransferase [Rahnella perminowiae]MBU9814269.1 dTDP-4-amino-4,6-dideoxy-D-galactose acyltransferase [Rahnella perminowiae]MCR8999462.1 dTDP-4-amino-4,6-dideoxy-D-galactose acyltransferase [Rahnella perminowiae]